MIRSFSVIIPFYKGDKFYSILINSIKNAILSCKATNISFEIITIIDSISTTYCYVNDLTSNCFTNIENVEIVTLKNEINIGVAASRNKAIIISKNNFLHIIDQDDRVEEMFYKELIPYLDKYNFILSNGLVKYENEKYNSHRLYYFKPNLSLKGLLKNDFIRSPGQVVFLKELLRNNFFPEPKNYKGADDRFFWIKMFVNNENKIQPFYIKTPNYIANIHDDNYSHDQVNLMKSSLENWGIIKNELNLTAYNKLINNDILRIRYSIKEKLTLFENFKGFLLKCNYFLDFNKVFRYIIKRKIC